MIGQREGSRRPVLGGSMNGELLFYGGAVAWFTHTCFRIGTLIYQFENYPYTFGKLPNITLNDLLDEARRRGRDLPTFRIVVPAFLESSVIAGTIARLASLNYPQTHFEVYIATYEDEPTPEGEISTYTAALTAAKKVNADAERVLVRPLLVPAGFDGYFPGQLDAEYQLIGKSRGLNFTLRRLHEKNEEDERSYFLGRMIVAGEVAHIDKVLRQASLSVEKQPEVTLERLTALLVDTTSPDYRSGLVFSRQFQALVDILNRIPSPRYSEKRNLLVKCVQHEAGRFYLSVELSGYAPELLTLKVMTGKRFLYDVVRQVEARSYDVLTGYVTERDCTLLRERPHLFQQLSVSKDVEAIYQQVHHFNSRWMMVFDADADAPVDVLRYLAARILVEPQVMGFQGPVAPIGNYHQVHPLCRLGGLWMGFWHNTSYPRLMQKLTWAHPLAGTNWCFRMDGIKSNEVLIRDCAYDESLRRFILSFDPKQLTEDLEAGIRIFSDWRVNAEWHPYIETEQVPPTPGAMVVQRTRWTEGTLQTLGYIMRSRLPLLQKLRFVLHPMEIMVSGSGPLITLALWLMIYFGDLSTNRVFMFWTVLLTFGNLLYIVSFQRSYVRFETMLKRNSLLDFLVSNGREVVQLVKEQIGQGVVTKADATLIHEVAERLREALSESGSLGAQMHRRCVDPDADSLDIRDYELAELRRATPQRLTRNIMQTITQELSALSIKAMVSAGRSQGQWRAEHAEGHGLQSTDLGELRQRFDHWGISGGFTGGWFRDRLQIWLWTFPYLFFQLAPYFKGLWYWLSGKPRSNWHKTPRTPKRVAGQQRRSSLKRKVNKAVNHENA